MAKKRDRRTRIGRGCRKPCVARTHRAPASRIGPRAVAHGRELHAGPRGTVFEIAKTAAGYASTPTILYSFCAQTNCADGAGPVADLITDDGGNLFGTTGSGGGEQFRHGVQDRQDD